MRNRVLVVDDELQVLSLLREALSEEGYDVECVPSGEAALELLDTENIQVVFLDLNLPGINGLELCRRIKKEKPIACIYAMTGYSSMFELSDCREAGCDDYFVKPFELEVILGAARDAFGKLERWNKR